MTDQQVAQMLKDVAILERYRNEGSTSLVDDVCIHVKALAGERDGYRAALEMILQIGHDYGEMKLARRICKAVLAGADMAEQEDAIAVCEETWKPKENR